MTFEQVADEWYTLKMVDVSVQYKLSIKCSIEHLCNQFGKKQIDKIKPKDIDLFISQFSRYNPNTGKPPSKKTISQALRIANNVFEYAMENELILKSPAYKKKPPKNSKTSKRRALSETEKKLIFATEHRAKLPAMIMMFAGLRRGEVIALKWSDIDFEERIISVNKSVSVVSNDRFSVKPYTKNGDTRKVIIPTVLYDYLIAEVKTAQYPLITAQINGQMHTPSSWVSMWRSYNTALNFSNNNQLGRSYYHPDGVIRTLDNITAHMLRHTYATMLWTAGVDVKSAAKLLGHRDISTTLGIYTHLENEKELMSIETFDRYLQKTTKNWIDNLKKQ